MILIGDALEQLRTLPAGSVQCCVTSPPYWGLRDYGVEGQMGLEPTPAEYVSRMVEVFREVRRVLRDDGTLWMNLGDSYASSQSSDDRTPDERASSSTLGPKRNGLGGSNAAHVARSFEPRPRIHDLKPKDLVGIPWRLAFALQADGWWLRSDIIWAKPNPMPESVTDRPTKSHEYVFLMSKSARYFYDAEAVKEEAIHAGRIVQYDGTQKNCCAGDDANDRRTLIDRTMEVGASRNLRTVWSIATQPFPGAHFATFPEELAERCIKAGTSERGCCGECGAGWERIVEKSGGTTGKSWHDHSDDLGRGQQKNESGMDTYRVETLGFRPTCTCNAPTTDCTVLDPFFGAGTVGLVARRLGRSYIGIELNPVYAEMARARIDEYAPLFGGVGT